MANSSNSKNGNNRNNRKNTSGSRSGNNRANTSRGNAGRNTNRNANVIDEPAVSPLVTVITTLVISIVVFLSNMGIFGTVGENISKFVFGVFGMPAYVLPILAVVLVFALYSVNEGSPALRRVLCSCGIYVLVSILMELINGVVLDSPEVFDPKAISFSVPLHMR